MEAIIDKYMECELFSTSRIECSKLLYDYQSLKSISNLSQSRTLLNKSNPNGLTRWGNLNAPDTMFTISNKNDFTQVPLYSNYTV